MFYVNLLVLTAVIIILIRFKKYDYKRLNKLYAPSGIYVLLYPTAYMLYHKIFRHQAAKSKQQLKKLYPMENVDRLIEEKYLKNISLAILILIVINIAALGILQSEKEHSLIVDGKYIERNSYGNGSRQADLIAILEDTKHPMTVDIGEKRYSREELAQLKERCEAYIKENVLGENTDFLHISQSLTFFNTIPGESVTVQWIVSDYSFIGLSGDIKNETLEAPIPLTVIAQCSYFDFTWEYPMDITVVPGAGDDEKPLDKQLHEAIHMQESKTIEDDYMELPQIVNGNNVSWEEKHNTNAGWVILLGIVLIAALFVKEGEARKKQEKARSLQLSMDYPVFVHKIVLLLGAGMTAKSAWFKMVADYEKALAENGERKYVYEEMMVSALEMEKGITEIAAYESFGRRCGQNQYLKFSSILIQSVRTGAKGLGRMLTDAADEALLMRRESAKRLGEEAGTKLLFPMVILLAVVMLILIIPAFMSMNF